MADYTIGTDLKVESSGVRVTVTRLDTSAALLASTAWVWPTRRAHSTR